MKTRIQSLAIPMGCFVIILLNINLYSNSLFAANNNTNRLHFRISSAAGFAVDSSGNNLLSANYILNKTQPDIEEGLQLESWMTQFNAYQNSNSTDTYHSSLSIEEEYSNENWMSDPDSFISYDNPDSHSNEVQAEEEIRFENWMINTSSWVEVPCQ